MLKLIDIEDPSLRIPIVDSRFEGAFRAGTVPTAKNIPFIEVLNADKTYKSPEEIIKIFQKCGIEDPVNQQVISSC